MKRLSIYLLFGILTLTSCKTESTPLYTLTVDAKQVTFDNQGKAVVSCTIDPKDTDISKIQMGYWQIDVKSNDKDWSAADIVSVTKDPQTPGKWNVNLALTRTVPTGSTVSVKNYVPKAEFFYYMKANVHFYVEKMGLSNNFDILVNINPIN